MLTPEQIAHVRCFGFLHVRGAFSANEIADMIAAAEQRWSDELGRPVLHSDVLSMARFVEHDPLLIQLMLDERIYEPARQLLGDDLVWSGSEGVHGYDLGNTAHHWHADRPGTRELGYSRLKFMLYLDPTRKKTGAFRVIPGSHQSPLHEALMSFQEAHTEADPTFFGLNGADIPCYALEAEPGDIVLFDHCLFHSVYHKTGRRRYIALKFTARPTQDWHLASIKRFAPSAFEPEEILIGSKDERIRRMVAVEDLAERAQTLEY